MKSAFIKYSANFFDDDFDDKFDNNNNFFERNIGN